MHAEAYAAVAKRLQALNKPPLRVVEFGSRNINGSVRQLFTPLTYTGVDCIAGPDVDVVMDAALFDPALPPDCVVCCEVLEHAEHAEDIMTNAVDILAPGGIIIVTCASDGRAPHSAVDGGALHKGEFYRNVPPALLLSWLEGAGAARVKVEHDVVRGDAYAIGFKP